MEELQNFSNGVINLPVRVLANGDIEFDAEQAALGLGISTIATSGNETVRWSRVNKYLGINEEPVIRGDFITEPQFYKLAFKANNETAEKFQDWVSSDVLPSIRKYGMYATPNTVDAMLDNPDTMIEILTRYKESQKQLQLQHDQIHEMKPKALFADAVSASHTSILVGDLAKMIKQNGVDMGARRLFSWLREHHYLISRKGADYNSPTQYSMERGLFEIKESTHINSDGVTVTTKTPKVTGKGQQYFINKFLNDQSA